MTSFLFKITTVKESIGKSKLELKGEGKDLIREGVGSYLK